MSAQTTKGCSFLFESASPDAIFTCEDLSEESLMLAETARRFAQNEVVPRKDALEASETADQDRVRLEHVETALLDQPSQLV